MKQPEVYDTVDPASPVSPDSVDPDMPDPFEITVFSPNKIFCTYSCVPVQIRTVVPNKGNAAEEMYFVPATVFMCTLTGD